MMMGAPEAFHSAICASQLDDQAGHIAQQPAASSRSPPSPSTHTSSMAASPCSQAACLAAQQRQTGQAACLAPAGQRAAALSSRASTLAGTAVGVAAAPRRAAAAAPARGAQRLAVTAAAAPGSAGTVAVAGATGLIGQALVRQLQAAGYSVRVLTRNAVAAKAKLPYPGLQFVAPAQWSAAVCGCTAVVNLAGARRCFRGSCLFGWACHVAARLRAVPAHSSASASGVPNTPPCCRRRRRSRVAHPAGEPIATRWTPEIKREVKRSRVDVTRQLAAAINACPADQRPGVLVNSSAVGYYGNSEVRSGARGLLGGCQEAVLGAGTDREAGCSQTPAAAPLSPNRLLAHAVCDVQREQRGRAGLPCRGV